MPHLREAKRPTHSDKMGNDMKSAGAHMPIIFITGHGDVPMTVLAMKAGAVEFLTKQFDDDMLLTSISHAIDRSSAARGDEVEIIIEPTSASSGLG
jgi:FixJ family two-component response regulator